jgi:large subunit ribosomal protein L10
MPTDAKQAVVAELAAMLAGAEGAIVADYRGLSVAEMARIRRELREKGITYRVVKNRLARIAARQAGRPELEGLFRGPSALATGGGDEAGLARGLIETLRPYRTVEVRGAAIRGMAYDGAAVSRLAELPGRDALLARLAGGMASPLGTMAGLLAAPLRGLAHALVQLREQRERAA